MGAYGLYRDKGQTSAQFFAKELLGPDDELLASAVIPTSYNWDSVFYGAVKRGDEVFAIVVPFAWRKSGGCNFYYKPLDETMGPCEGTCPTKILDLLTPTDSEWANEWRQRCRDYAATHPRVKDGETIVLSSPLAFTNGDKLNVFTKTGKHWTSNGYRYRIGKELPAYAIL